MASTCCPSRDRVSPAASQLRLLDRGRRPPATLPPPRVRSMPFNSAAARNCCPFEPPSGSLCGCGCSQDRGRRRTGRAASWRASFRGRRDHDVGGQDAHGEDAQQQRLHFYRIDTEVYVGLPSGNVRLDFTGAHQHLHLEHLVHLGVHLAGLLGIAAVDMETLSEGDRWRSPPSVAPNLQIRRPSNPA